MILFSNVCSRVYIKSLRECYNNSVSAIACLLELFHCVIYTFNHFCVDRLKKHAIDPLPCIYI